MGTAPRSVFRILRGAGTATAMFWILVLLNGGGGGPPPSSVESRYGYAQYRLQKARMLTTSGDTNLRSNEPRISDGRVLPTNHPAQILSQAARVTRPKTTSTFEPQRLPNRAIITTWMMPERRISPSRTSQTLAAATLLVPTDASMVFCPPPRSPGSRRRRCRRSGRVHLHISALSSPPDAGSSSARRAPRRPLRRGSVVVPRRCRCTWRPGRHRACVPPG